MMNFMGKMFGYGTAPAPDQKVDNRTDQKTSENKTESQKVLNNNNTPSNNEPPTYESLEIESPDTEQGSAIVEQEKTPEADKKSLWNLIKGLIGVDITTTVSLPIWLFEDYSYLQRLCEMAEFCTFLDQAANTPNRFERLMYVTLFCITEFHSSERYDKPFNPVIGETFEFIRPDNNATFIAEQVSHKPPISACHLENENFVCWQQGILNVRFWGNSLDLDSTGSKGYISLKKYGDMYAWTTPRATVHNAIVGSVWVDHYGLMPIKNYTTGDKIELRWKKCGWFGSNRYEVEGDIVDADGNVQLSVFGKWNKSLSVTWHFDGMHPKGTTVCMWTKDPTVVGKHRVPPYALELNKMDEEYEKLLPPTDSRLRPDRRALEREDLNKASVYKLQVEEKQRNHENARKARNDPWVPKWFSMVPDAYIDGTTWIYTGDYWEQREKKKALLATNQEAQNILVREDISNLACNFRNYPQID